MPFIYNSCEVTNQNYNFFKSYDFEISEWMTHIPLLTKCAFGKLPIEPGHLRKFDQSLLFGFTNREMILTLLHQVNSSLAIQNEYISKILHPPSYLFGTDKFQINLYTNYISQASMKYISNVDAYEIVSEAKKILSLGNLESFDIQNLRQQTKRVVYRGQIYSGEKLAILLREACLMKNFVERYSTSRRLLSLPKLIQVVVESSAFDEARGFPWNENPILYTLRLLYQNYTDFPFREIELTTEYQAKTSMILPELTFALIELWFKYVLMDMTKTELVMAINIFLEWSCTSLDQRLLDFKDSRLNVSKILVEHTVSFTGIRHNVRGFFGIITNPSPSEIWITDPMRQSSDYLEFCEEFFKNVPKALCEYLIEIGILSDASTFSHRRVISSLKEMRRLYMVINLACQHGLFIKNPVILTLEKSILPRASISFTPKTFTVIENFNIYSSSLPFQFSWEESPIFREMMYEGRKLISAYSEKYNQLDLEAEWIKVLTNNSGGVEYVPTAEECAEIPSEVLKTISKKRLMFFLLNPTLYESYDAWIRGLKSETSSGERKQVDRRGRVIQMVSNVGQLAPFLVFMWVDLMGKIEPELASKKNTGTISDMQVLLQTTSDITSVQESADISGMDASTTRVMTSFINSLTIDLLQTCSHKRYFFSQRAQWTRKKEDDGIRSKIDDISVHPGVPIIQINEAVGETYTFKLHIPELSAYGYKTMLDTSPHVFASGKQNTNAQHSLLNLVISRTLQRSMLPELVKLKVPVSHLITRVSGDDIFMSFSTPGRSLDAERHFSRSLVKIFTQLGFKIGSLLSRYGATFLQQSACFGLVLPKPDRISLTTSERGDSLKMGTFDAFNEFRDIMKELMSRVSFPSNSRGLLVLTANQLRRVRVEIKDLEVEIVEKLRTLQLSMYHEDLQFCISRCLDIDHIPYRILIGKGYVHFFVPLISLFTSFGFDLPFNPMVGNQYVPSSNVFAARGGTGDWKIRKLLRKQSGFQEPFQLTDDLRKKLFPIINDDDMTKIKERLRKAGSSLEASICTYLHAQYDVALAHFFGLHWLNHFGRFSIKSVLDRMRISKFPKEVRENWADRLGFRLNFDAIVRSRLAGEKLEAAGFKTSNRLAFYNTPNERISQAITAGGDSAHEFKVHRRLLLIHMCGFEISNSWMQEVNYEVLLTIDFQIDSTTMIPMSNAFIIDVFAGLMPSSGKDMERDFTVYKFGHNWYDISTSFSGYHALTPGPYKDYKHDDLVKFAAKVSRERPDLLTAVWEFANVHPRYRLELEQIIRFGETSDINLWKSIIHTRQCFEISTSIRHVPSLWHYFGTNDRRLDRTLTTIARDIALSENLILQYKAYLKVHLPILLLHGTMHQKVMSLASLR